MKQNPQRILAILALILIALALIAVVYCAITGSEYFWTALGCVMLFPVIIWGLLLIARHLK